MKNKLIILWKYIFLRDIFKFKFGGSVLNCWLTSAPDNYGAASQFRTCMWFTCAIWIFLWVCGRMSVKEQHLSGEGHRSSYLFMQGWCGHSAPKRWWHYSTDTLVVFETPPISANIWTTLPAWRQPTRNGTREMHTSSTCVYTICPVSVSQLPLLRHCGQYLTGLYLLNPLWWMKKWQPSLLEALLLGTW